MLLGFLEPQRHRGTEVFWGGRYCDHPVVAMVSVKTGGRTGTGRARGMQWGLVRGNSPAKCPKDCEWSQAGRGCVAQGFNLKRAVEFSTLFGFWHGMARFFDPQISQMPQIFLGWDDYGNSRKEHTERKGFWRLGPFNPEAQRCGTGILPVWRRVRRHRLNTCPLSALRLKQAQ